MTDAGLAPDARTILGDAVRELVVVDTAGEVDPGHCPCELIRRRVKGGRQARGVLSPIAATTRWPTSGCSCQPGGRAGRAGCGETGEETRGDSVRPRVLPAAATRGPTATSTRTTRRPSSFPMTSPRFDRTVRLWRHSMTGSSAPRVNGGSAGSCAFSPRHDLTLGRMAPDAIRRVIDVWADQTAELGAVYQWVQVFENRGEAMGASNPHPHGQVRAGPHCPVPAPGSWPRNGRTGRRPASGCCCGVCGSRDGGTAGHRRERPVARRRPVLGGRAVRDAGHPQASGGGV